jgi:hypothetical protein
VSPIAQSALVVQSWAEPAGHLASQRDVNVARPVATSQHTSPAVVQLFEPEHVRVLPRQVPASLATHVRVATQHSSSVELHVLVPHTIWSIPPSPTGGGIMRPPSVVGAPLSSTGCVMLPSGPTGGKPLSSTPVLPPLLLLPLPLPLAIPPPLLLAVPLLLPVPPELPLGPPSLLTEDEEPPHPMRTTIDTPRIVRKDDMKDLLARDTSRISNSSVGTGLAAGYTDSTHDGA